MIGERTPPSGVPLGTLIVLMLAVATVSLGFGIVLPLLPDLVQGVLQLKNGALQISWHTGFLTSIYVLGLFLFAPLWGRLSDQFGRKGILILGLVGLAASMLVVSVGESIFAVYGERFLSGMFAAAVTPVASATIGDLAATDESRARRLTLLSVAAITGFLAGPMLGLFLSRLGEGIVLPFGPSGPLTIPLTATALAALPVAVAVAFAVPGASHKISNRAPPIPADQTNAAVVFKLMLLAFIVSSGVSAFEVGLALRGKGELGLSQGQVAMMFTECSLVMIVVQAIVFSPLVKPASTRWLITPSLAVMAIGLFLVPGASSFTLMMVVIGAVAASSGVVLPILTY